MATAPGDRTWRGGVLRHDGAAGDDERDGAARRLRGDDAAMRDSAAISVRRHERDVDARMQCRNCIVWTRAGPPRRSSARARRARRTARQAHDARPLPSRGDAHQRAARRRSDARGADQRRSRVETPLGPADGRTDRPTTSWSCRCCAPGSGMLDAVLELVPRRARRAHRPAARRDDGGRLAVLREASAEARRAASC